MSLATWKAEFYPVEAKDVPKRDALAHSLKKWKGFRESRLLRHSLRNGGYEVLKALGGGGYSCALCFWHRGHRCGGCPLYKALGRVCFGDGPYGDFVDHNDPEPMIAALKKAKEWEEKRK